MSVAIEITICCDDCDRTFEPSLRAKNPTTARTEARRDGWGRLREDRLVKDICPDCITARTTPAAAVA